MDALAGPVQEGTGHNVAVAWGDQGDTGAEPAAAAADHGIELAVVSLPTVTRGCVRLPRR